MKRKYRIGNDGSMSTSRTVTEETCPKCNGQRTVEDETTDIEGYDDWGNAIYSERIIDCPTCNGKGYITR